MIEKLTITNFKSFRKAELNLGPMNIFIGTNASGKSNFFDALRFLQGVGAGFTLDEILNGKPRSATSEVWEGIRGGSGLVSFRGRSPETTFELTFRNPWNVLSESFDYHLGFDSTTRRIQSESLHTGAMVFDAGRDGRVTDDVIMAKYLIVGDDHQPVAKFDSARPILGQFVRGYASKDVPLTPAVAEARVLLEYLDRMQQFDPTVASLRNYSSSPHAARMGDRGENFAALVKTIRSDEKSKSAYLSWLKELRPAEIDDVGVLSGAVGEPLFMVKEGGKEFPAQVLSDGTLRFAAIAAAFFQPDMPSILTLEEIENGIHASRLRLMVELLRSQAAEGKTQVMATTHSPIVLAWLKPEEYQHTFFCKRDEATGESIIKPLTEIPHFLDVVKRQPIGDLFSEGWLEAAL